MAGLKAACSMSAKKLAGLRTPKLHRSFPRLSLHWLEATTATLVRDLDIGSLDAALLALEAPIGDLDCEVLARDPFVLATPRDHPLGARALPARPAELRDASVLLLDDGHCFREQALAFCANARAQELEFRATSLSTLAQMVAGGSGVTLLPQLAVATETRRARLRIRPFVSPAPARTLGLVWRKRSPLVTTLRQIAAAIRAAYPDAKAR